MKRFFMSASVGAIAVLLLLNVVARAQVVVVEPGPANQRIYDFPTFEGKWYLTAIYSSENTAQDQLLRSHLYTDPFLHKMTEICNFNEWTDDAPWLKDTDWAKYIGQQRPCLLLQAPVRNDDTAEVVLFIKGDEILDKLSTLRKRIKIAVRSWTKRQQAPRCPNGQCPLPRRDFSRQCPDGQCPTPRRQPWINVSPRGENDPGRLVNVDVPDDEKENNIEPLPSIDPMVDLAEEPEIPSDIEFADEDESLPTWVQIIKDDRLAQIITLIAALVAAYFGYGAQKKKDEATK